MCGSLSILWSSARASRSPPPAAHLVRSRASASWRLKVSGGRPRLGRRVGGRPGSWSSGVPGRPRRRWAPERLCRLEGPGPRPGRLVGGAAPPDSIPGLRGSVGLGPRPGATSRAAPADRYGAAGAAASSRRRRVGGRGGGRPVRPCRPGGTGWRSPGAQGVPRLPLTSPQQAALPRYSPSSQTGRPACCPQS